MSLLHPLLASFSGAVFWPAFDNWIILTVLTGLSHKKVTLIVHITYQGYGLVQISHDAFPCPNGGDDIHVIPLLPENISRAGGIKFQ